MLTKETTKKLSEVSLIENFFSNLKLILKTIHQIATKPTKAIYYYLTVGEKHES